MVRLLAVLATLFALSLAACGEDDGASQAPTPSAALSPSEPLSSTATQVPSPVNPSRNQLSFLIDGELYLINSDGTGKVRMGEDGICPRWSRIAWSPDGTRFVCSGGDSTVLLKSDGTPLEQWAEGVRGEVQWSPTSAAFAVPVNDRLAVRDRDGAELVGLGPTDIAPVGVSIAGRSRLWSPDGDQIAYWNAASAELRAYSLESGSERTVAGDYRPMLWLADGHTIVAAAGYKPPVDLQVTIYDVLLVDVSTGNASPVPELMATLEGPVRPDLQLWFSPDTSKAAVLTGRPGELPGIGVFDIQTRALTPIPDSIISYQSDFIPQGNVHWSADGETLYWIDMGGPATVYRATVDGTGLTRLVDCPQDCALSQDLLSLVYVEYAPDMSSRLYISEVNDSAPRMIDSRPGPGGPGPSYSWAWRPAP